MVGMDSEWSSLLWDEKTSCSQVHEDIIDQSSFDSEGHCMLQTVPLLDYTSDHSLFSTTSSPSWYTTPDQPLFDHSNFPSSTGPLPGWTDSELQPEGYWDSTESSSAHTSDADLAKTLDGKILPAMKPPPPTPVSDRLAMSPALAQSYESEDSQSLSKNISSATGTAISPNSAATRRPGILRRHGTFPPAHSRHVFERHKDAPSSRIPHNAVERKYREGLNAALKRLRRAVPTLPQERQGEKIGTPRLSKSMIIAGAIEYIERLESEKRLALTSYQTSIGSRKC
ncbi:hypothetical protein E8E12_011552 [Didymella heteroderae]|uniref:BHLH domain-containing protein n=1 Tax=Didymella heteroderae TaxID=1769908 RepID=A0A9P4WZB2_9PLEO|nr:hypothetical protein E8E12_011552 [Didymella heteroderae]